MRHKHSEYMHWAKTQSQARFNLASSGVGAFPLDQLAFDFSSLQINGDNSYGYAPLQEAIAQHHGVDAACVVQAAGTSMANHLAMAAILEPGDEVLMEHPAYGPMLDVATYLGATVKRFHRTEAGGWVVNPAEIRRAITPATKLIVMTNLHNPTSVLTPSEVLREVGKIAADVGAFVLVDEAYLEAMFDDTPPTSFHLGPQFVATGSLTKVYGVSGLRCGWILAQPEPAWRMRRLDDLFSATPVHPGEQLSVAAFHHLPLLREKSRRAIEADRAMLAQFLAGEPGLVARETPWGTTIFPRLREGTLESFLKLLREEFDTSVVPGRFFEMPDYFRIGLGVNHEMFAEGLRRISRALAEKARGRN